MPLPYFQKIQEPIEDSVKAQIRYRPHFSWQLWYPAKVVFPVFVDVINLSIPVGNQIAIFESFHPITTRQGVNLYFNGCSGFVKCIYVSFAKRSHDQSVCFIKNTIRISQRIAGSKSGHFLPSQLCKLLAYESLKYTIPISSMATSFKNLAPFTGIRCITLPEVWINTSASISVT